MTDACNIHPDNVIKCLTSVCI